MRLWLSKYEDSHRPLHDVDSWHIFRLMIELYLLQVLSFSNSLSRRESTCFLIPQRDLSHSFELALDSDVASVAIW